MQFPIGIIAGVAGLGAVLAAVAEASLRRLGEPLVLDQTVDWHDLSLRIVGGDARGALSDPIQTALRGTVHASVAAGFGAALSVAAILAILASLASWRLIRAAGTRSSQSGTRTMPLVCRRRPPCSSSWVAVSMCRSSRKFGYADQRHFDCLICA